MTTNMENNQSVEPNNKPQDQAIDHNNIKYVIAVMSGKGGVGKSMTTGLIASSLARDGFNVGILDADITGPSIPMLFGLHGPVVGGKYGIVPLISRSGIKVMSTNLLLASEEQPVVWRGPLISKMIKQLWTDVEWGNLDYLLVDLPPGTSDAALTIMQSLPVKGLIMVTTPQKLAALIVNKAVHMAQEIGVSIVGVIENMAYYRCPDTGKKHYIFGQSNGASVTHLAKAPLLAQIPIDPAIAELCDARKIEDIVLEDVNEMIEKLIKSITSNSGERIPEERTSEKPGENNTTGKQAPSAASVVENDQKEDQKFKQKLSEKARKLIESKENMGPMEKPDASGYFRGRCGDNMQIDLRIQENTITAAKFITDGCGATIACGSMLTKMATQKTLTEAEQITPNDLMVELEGLPKDHEHCAELAVMTLREAIIDATDRRVGS